MPTATPAFDQFYILFGEEHRGPYTLHQLRAMWNSGAITGQQFYSQPGFDEWVKIEEMRELLEPRELPPQMPLHVYTTPVVVRVPKSRGIYIVLGLLFGALGIHNFYAGHFARGISQLLITLIFGWFIIGIAVTCLWALIEIIAETTDGDGQRMV